MELKNEDVYDVEIRQIMAQIRTAKLREKSEIHLGQLEATKADQYQVASRGNETKLHKLQGQQNYMGFLDRYLSSRGRVNALKQDVLTAKIRKAQKKQYHHREQANHHRQNANFAHREISELVHRKAELEKLQKESTGKPQVRLTRDDKEEKYVRVYEKEKEYWSNYAKKSQEERDYGRQRLKDEEFLHQKIEPKTRQHREQRDSQKQGNLKERITAKLHQTGIVRQKEHRIDWSVLKEENNMNEKEKAGQSFETLKSTRIEKNKETDADKQTEKNRNYEQSKKNWHKDRDSFLQSKKQEREPGRTRETGRVQSHDLERDRG